MIWVLEHQGKSLSILLEELANIFWSFSCLTIFQTRKVMSIWNVVFLRFFKLSKIPQRFQIPPECAARGRFLLILAANTKIHVSSQYCASMFQIQKVTSLCLSMTYNYPKVPQVPRAPRNVYKSPILGGTPEIRPPGEKYHNKILSEFCLKNFHDWSFCHKMLTSAKSP